MASSSLEKKFDFPSVKVGNDEMDYLMGTMRKICDEAGFRYPGTEGERKGAEIFKAEYEKWADEVHEEKFEMAPDAYPGAMIKPIGYLFFISVVLYFVFPILAWIVLIPMAFWGLELFGLKRAVDWAYPKKPSQNIYAKIKPLAEPKTIMVFAGHNDSPKVFPLTARWRKKAQDAVMLIFISSLIFVLLGIIRASVATLKGTLVVPPLDSWWMVAGGILGVLLVPVVIYVTQNFVSDKLCLGANDNLSGAISALTLARYFKDHRPLNTELWFVAFGSEEAGQRGSTHFAKTHFDELNRMGAYVINLESIGGGNFLLFATAEIMCMPHIPHHQDVYNLLKEASRQVVIRRQCVRSELSQGYTDAEPFSRLGLKASSILGLMLDGFPLLWHIETDTPDNLHPGCMRDALEVCIKAVELRDKELGSSTIATI
jgi:hypothetical protein